MTSLGDAFPMEQARLRELLDVYKDLGPVGAFGHAAISAVLQDADKAAISGDVVWMVRAFKAMQECQ